MKGEGVLRLLAPEPEQVGIQRPVNGWADRPTAGWNPGVVGQEGYRVEHLGDWDSKHGAGQVTGNDSCRKTGGVERLGQHCHRVN